MKYVKIEIRTELLPETNNEEKNITKFVDKTRFIRHKSILDQRRITNLKFSDLKIPEKPIL